MVDGRGDIAVGGFRSTVVKGDWIGRMDRE